MLSQRLPPFFANRTTFALLSPRRFFCFTGFLITKLALVKLDNAAVGDNHVATVFVASVNPDPARHNPLKEVSRLFDLAAEYVHEVINVAPALLHHSAKLLERDPRDWITGVEV